MIAAMPSPSSRRTRWLLAARLCGVGALGVVAQVGVDMPEGYFGAADVVTAFGAGYAALSVLAAAALVAAEWRRPRWAAWGVPLLLAANVGLFAPAVVSDPVVGGLVVLWNLALLAQRLFPPPAGRPRHAAGEADDAWLAVHGAALRHLAVVSLLLTAAVVGYRLSGSALAHGVCLLLDYGTLAGAAPFLLRLHRRRRRSPWLVAAPAAASLLALGRPAVTLTFVAVALAVLLVLILGRQQATLEVLADFYARPSRLIFISFASLIGLGTLLLTFPAASAGPSPLTPLDALFTATSATCVTGLIVLDTPHAFSPFGHAVILALIQVGGLGIMVVSTFATLLLGGSLGLRGEKALSELLEIGAASTAYRLTRFIVLSTLAVEAVGASLLTGVYMRWGAAGGLGFGEALWRGVFHAVSAFCNAGFALQSDSIVGFQRSPVALAVFAALIVLGGLGFAVLAAVAERFGRRADRRALRRAGAPAATPVSTQVKVVVAVSALLVAGGAVVYALLEWERSLAGLPVLDRLTNAVFQSVTLRTAGFNSVDFAALAPATVVVMLLLMFVGASPGSTGGGIKTTTFAVLFAALRSTVERGEPVRLFDREIPRQLVLRSLAILLVSALAVVTGLFALLLFEPQPFLDLAFEVVSAFGTVGLSLGATALLGPAGKLIIIVLMFVGRIGPLTLALVLGTGVTRRAVARYPQSRLMVG